MPDRSGVAWRVDGSGSGRARESTEIHRAQRAVVVEEHEDMPAYRFTWDRFTDETVDALADAIGYEPGLPARTRREFLSTRVPRPDDAFVRLTKDVLARCWIPVYPAAKQLIERLSDDVGPVRSPRTPADFTRYIEDTRNCKTLRTALLDALHRFGDANREEDSPVEDSFVRRFVILDRSVQPSDPIKAHDYQREAWEKLSAHLAEADVTGVFQGLLVMPTGAGKTFTAVRWLAERALSRGMRVLWLAHRRELLQHAAAEFHRCAGLAGVDKLRVRIVSGGHCASVQIDPADHVVVASVASLARRRDVREALLADPRLFVVIDEAHHAPAKTYRDIIGQLQRQKRFRVLGLTATPTRTVEDERSELARLFGGRLIYRVDMRRLVERGTLSRPVPRTVPTRADVVAELTEEDRVRIGGGSNEISEAGLDRIARLELRNNVIVDEYLTHRAKYGKTLIFAINIMHAALLTERLRAHGVRVDYVASERPDGSDGDPTALIQSFREGGLDVLVNVQMMTEGVDVPDIQTVFVTRPTNSEILFRQMVGRGLRGVAAGGTAKAFLVAFEDQWRQYHEWEHPFDLVPDIVELAELPEGTVATPTETLSAAVQAVLPWDVIRAVAARMRTITIDQKADAFDAIPHGRYVFEREEPGEVPILGLIHVYEHQHGCWEALLDDLYGRSSRENLDLQTQYVTFFGDCDDPTVSIRDCEALILHWYADGDRPEYLPLKEREDCDPHVVAHKIWDANLGERASSELVDRHYGLLAQAIYRDRREYFSAVEDAKYELRHPDESTRRIRGVPVFASRPDMRLAPGPPLDIATDRLRVLLRETLAHGSELLGIDITAADVGIKLDWTKDLIKGWYASAYHENDTPHGTGRIRVNVLLNSPDVTAATMRFVLWHEYLHLYLKARHPPSFRELERRWPNHVEAYRELFSINERFSTPYW